MKTNRRIMLLILFIAGTGIFTLQAQNREERKELKEQTVKKIDRINELYHKSKSVGLTEKEKSEQAALRREYLAAIRGSLRNNLNNISIVEKDGSVTDLGKKYGGIKEV